MRVAGRTRIPARCGWLIALTACAAPAAERGGEGDQRARLADAEGHRADGGLRRADRDHVGAPSAALPVDRLLRGVQLPGLGRPPGTSATNGSPCGWSIACIMSWDATAATMRAPGWISGLGEREGEDHPTQGGLRIGKRLPERRPGDPFDEQLEWDRDGQYFHYLTRWMHALDLVARSTREPRFNVWARELAAEGARRLHATRRRAADAPGCTGR